MTCSIDGCQNPRYARNMCSPHYQRWRRRNTPDGGDNPESRPPRTCGSGHPGTPATPLAARLKRLRQQSGMTSTALAERLRTGASRVTDWELGVNTPTLPTLQRYAQEFDITVSQLLDGIM